MKELKRQMHSRTEKRTKRWWCRANIHPASEAARWAPTWSPPWGPLNSTQQLAVPLLLPINYSRATSTIIRSITSSKILHGSEVSLRVAFSLLKNNWRYPAILSQCKHHHLLWVMFIFRLERKRSNQANNAHHLPQWKHLAEKKNICLRKCVCVSAIYCLT